MTGGRGKRKREELTWKRHEGTFWEVRTCSLFAFGSLSLTEGFPESSVGKEFTCSAGDLGSIPGLGRSPGEGNGYPLQYSCLEDSMDYTVHGVTKSRTRLSDFHFHWGSESGITLLTPGCRGEVLSRGDIVDSGQQG